MRKPALRPFRLISVSTGTLDSSEPQEENSEVKDNKRSSGLVEPVSTKAEQQLPGDTLPKANAEVEARHLLKRTPGSYLLNQVYGLWVFSSLFLLTVLVTRKLSVAEYGVYAVSLAAFNTIAYIIALGLEDATTTFVPRVFAEHGRAAAALLVRRLLAIRLAVLTITVTVMLFTLPILSRLITALPVTGSAVIAAGLRSPSLLGHITPIAFWVLGNGITSLFTAIYASQMRMRIVFICGSVAQVLLLGLSFIMLQLGWGIDSVLWLQAICSLLTATVFMLWQAPLLLTRGATYKQSMQPVMRVGISAWITNLISGALLKQVSIILLAYFAVSVAQIAYFNLSFQLADAASLLLVSG